MSAVIRRLKHPRGAWCVLKSIPASSGPDAVVPNHRRQDPAPRREMAMAHHNSPDWSSSSPASHAAASVMATRRAAAAAIQ